MLTSGCSSSTPPIKVLRMYQLAMYVRSPSHLIVQWHGLDSRTHGSDSMSREKG